MPFGLTNAPAVFQALVNDILRDMLDRFVFFYLDDILIFSRGIMEHGQHVQAVLQRLQENQLYVKAEKCQFHALEFVIAPGSVQMDLGKVSAVIDWPRPESRKQLQQILGFANFYWHFIKNYSIVVVPLTSLTSTKRVFVWMPEADVAFLELKRQFATAPSCVCGTPVMSSWSRWTPPTCCRSSNGQIIRTWSTS